MPGENELKVVLGAEADSFNDQMQKAVGTMIAAADAFKKAAVVISKAAADMGAAVAGIRVSLKDTATASVAAGKTISDLGKSPLQDLRTLDAQIRTVKATLATGFKSDIDKIKLQRLDFGNLNEQASASDKTIINLGSNVILASKGFGELNKQANLLPPTLVNASNAAVGFSKNLSGMSTQPLQEIKTLDAVLSLLQATLGKGFEVNVDATALNPTAFKQTIAGIEALRTAIANLDANAEGTTATAQQLIATFQSGFSQGAIQELQKAGVSVADFRAALTGLSGVIGGNLTPLISVLDAIQAESQGTSDSVKTVGAAIAAMGPLINAPLFNLQKFDEQLLRIKATLGQGFKIDIEKVPLSGADFVGVEAQVKKVGIAVQGVNSSFRGTQKEISIVKAGVSPLVSVILPISKAASDAGISLKTMGRAPLADLKNLEDEIRNLKATLASGVTTNINKITLALTAGRGSIGSAFSGVTAEFVKFQTQARAADAAAKRLNDTVESTGKRVSAVTPATRDAAFALQNVGRIAQDLPFGLIGIQNNITPLIESFVQLGRTSGGTAGFLTTLGKSLIGPAGLLLAVSIIPAAIQIATTGIANFTKKTHDAANAADEFRKTLKSVRDIQGQGAADASGEIEKVRALAAAVLDTNKSYGERKNALNTLHETNKAYFGDLSLESTSLKTLTGRVNEYTNALIAQAVVKGFETELGRVNSELATQTGKFTDLKTKADAAQKTLDKFGPDPRKLTNATTEEAGLVAARVSSYQKLKDAADEANAAVAAQR